METAGFVIGAVALLAGFKGAVDGAQLLSDIYHSFEGSSFYSAKFAIEKQRLQIWGAFFGFNDQEQCEKLKNQPLVSQSLVLYILKEFEDASTNVDKLKSKYGLQLADTGVESDPKAYTKLKQKSDLLDSLAERQKELGAKLKWWRKGLPWVLDLPNFEKLLDRLEYLNDSLERVVPRVDLSLLTQGLASFLIPSQPQAYLQTFQQSSQQYVAMCAVAKQVKLTTGIIKQVPKISPDDIKSPSIAEKLHDQSTRVLATYHNGITDEVQEVVIDWKEPNLSLNITQRDEVQNRIRKLCLLFQEISQDQNSDFRILPCLGLIEEPEFAQQHVGHKKFGFVFKQPNADAGMPESLHQSFTRLSNVAIGDRFMLAQRLASGLLLLHSSKWLHKNVRSENVLLFPRKSRPQEPFDTACLAAPYLMGFSYSRPDSPNEVSMERPPVTGTVDFYLRPDSQKGHSRLNDLYGLGVVLFETGHWKSIMAICQNYKLTFSTENEVRDFLIGNCKKGGGLGARMGDIYASVVHRCLSGDFGIRPDESDEGALPRAFWSLVVRQLDACRA